MKRKIPAYTQEFRALFAIAWPTLIAQVAQMATGVVDTVMAGHYSAVDLAAIAIGYNIWLPLYLVFIGVMLGATTIIAQDYGAGRVQRIRACLPQALWLALLLGLVAGPLLYSAEPLLHLLDLAPQTHARSLGYLQATAFGLPAAALFQALRCHTQGIGFMRPFALASVLGFLANIPLNYALIYGKWGAPELGAAGCGWATAISMWLSPLLIGVYMLRARDLRPYLPDSLLVAPRLDILRDILRLGTPMGLSFFLEVGVFSVIGLLIATLGDTVMAAHQIAYNVWDVTYIFLISVGSALATRVGHAVGAGDSVAVQRAIACGACATLLIGAVCSLVLLTGPGLIIAAFTGDADIQRVAAALVGLAALFIVIDAAQVTATFCLRAFKDTTFPFLVLCGTYWLLTLPLGYYWGMLRAEDGLAGALGFWRAMIAGIALTSAVLLWRLYRTLQRPLSAPAT
ncbi:MAG: MATE family efflux transporter [Halioglobus sp.]|nr:MATE family efflux transporter [Halioglobus sp.]|tara:strand:+ start:2935 stop:4305 length:1371 start_codon:yes stop_codon:yes gene_type:complete